MRVRINKYIESASNSFNSLLTNEVLKDSIYKATNKCIEAFKSNKKVHFCGNGGSASDAQHIAAELSGRFYKDIPPLNAEALHVNSSFMTAVANDYGFKETYARMIEASSKKGDVLIAISTSGNSENIINAIKKAKEMGVYTIGFTGKNGGQLRGLCDLTLHSTNDDTPRIQESHILFGHIICQIIEEEIFPNA